MHFFDEVYRGTPPWEIGRPQPVFVHLEESGEIAGRVLDVGCGTGENALYFASRGHEVWGVDFAPTAIERARTKATERSLPVTFRSASALALESLGERFDTVTDCGLFHTFSDLHRTLYADSVGTVLLPGGRLFVLCFSEHEPTDWGGPRRVTQGELRETFRDGWEVRWIREARFETRLESVEGRAWVAALRRTGRRSPSGLRKQPSALPRAEPPRENAGVRRSRPKPQIPRPPSGRGRKAGNNDHGMRKDESRVRGRV